uniref:Heat shock protein 70-like protein n=1 Tax=croton golden spot associated virus A TaxID=3072821 RepID=A0AA51N477_9CLOS|nr:heat shock protein 70-like protein [croton golden spot associated virus A]
MEVGIDFGTTFSTLSFSPGTGVAGCSRESDEIYIPTVLGVRLDKTFCIGRAAMADDTVLLYRDIKRWVGCNKLNEGAYREKLKPEYEVVVSEWEVSIANIRGPGRVLRRVVDLIYLFIKGMVTLATQQTSLGVKLCSCSVPADYNSFKRSFVYEACKALDIGVQAVVNEPTAAGLSTFVMRDVMQTPWLLVYDFGGGTFDVSLLAAGTSAICVIDSLGDNYLGGRDVDNAMRKHISARLGVTENLVDSFSMEDIKIRVVDDPVKETHTVLLTDGTVRTVNFSNKDLQNIAAPFVARARDKVAKVLARNKCEKIVVVLIGGSSVLPGVRSSVTSLPGVMGVIFDKKTYRAAVAIGAAMYTQSFSMPVRFKLIDCVSASLSDERRNLRAVTILPKGHPIPTVVTRDFTMPNFNTGFVLHEGESPIAWKNERTYSAYLYLGEFRARTEGKLQLNIGEDGRISSTLFGKPLDNKVKIQNVSDSVKGLLFEDLGVRQAGPAVLRYLLSWSVYTKKNFNIKVPIQQRIEFYKENLTKDADIK